MNLDPAELMRRLKEIRDKANDDSVPHNEIVYMLDELTDDVEDSAANEVAARVDGAVLRSTLGG